MHNDKELLIVTYSFPPGNSPAAQRPFQIAKHITRCGWKPVILTAASADDSYNTSECTDECHEFKTIRSFNIAPRSMRGLKRQAFIDDKPSTLKRAAQALYSAVHRLCIPDKAAPWIPFAVAAGSKLQNTHAPNAIFSTSPAFSNHLVAQLLHSRSRIPWVADFRDYHYIEALENEAGVVRRSAGNMMERGVMNAADAVVFISEQMRDRYATRYPNLTSKAHVVPNGFDPEEFSPSVLADIGPLTIFYAGSFCRGERSPAPLLACLDELVERGHIRAEEILIQIAGVVDRDVLEIVKRFHISKSVKMLGVLSRVKTLKAMQQAHLLWLIVGAPHSHADGFPTKGYEYIGARRPILAFVPTNSNAASVIAETGAGELLDLAEDREAVGRNCAKMLTFISQYRTGELRKPLLGDASDLQMYTRQFQARQIADIAEMISARTSDGSSRYRTKLTNLTPTLPSR